ncbi:hypothetical protein RND81_12G065200 [Saponaria officinalis]|uniref:DUF1677 family protein n=1 Tax=Saponaria officinalis TaxID=3572 RepID=A0AAW1H7B7_SAPOF
MEILVKCECCGLKEECTNEYIDAVKSKFNGKWLCGLCSEAVGDEAGRAGVEDAVRAHMSFCRKQNSSPASMVADGMRQMLRRRSGELTQNSSATKKYGRSASVL